MRKILVATGIAAIIAGVFLLKGKPATQESAPPPVPTLRVTPRDSVPVPVAVDRAESILRGGERDAIRSLAAEWRGRAREDAEFRGRLAKIVLDETASSALRELAAFVLGTIGHKDGLRALGEALGKAGDPGWARTLLLALGCDRTSADDDDIFDLPNTPRVIVSPLGLAVRIRGKLDADLIAPMVMRTRSSEAAEVRWAAALALADSTSRREVRDAFLSALPAERDPATEGELAKALSGWAAEETTDSPDRLRVVAAIFDGAARPEATALRFRSEEGLARMSWTSAEARLLTTRTEEGSLDQRRWAIAVLAGAASRLESSDQSAAIETLTRISTSGAEAKAREFAVSGLAGFGGRASPALIAALADPAWHVRAAAVRALGRVGKSDAVISALRDAEAKDADERVRRAAAEVRRAYGAD